MKIETHKAKLYLFLMVVIFLFLYLPLKGEHKSREYPRFYLCFAYISGRIRVGDINNCLISFNNNDLFNYVRKYNPGWEEVQGEIIPLPGKFNSFELSLYVEFKSRLSLGLSILEPIQKSNESSLLFSLYIDNRTQRMNYYFKPKYWLLFPFEYTLYYKIIDNPKFRFSGGAGSGFYVAGISRTFIYTMIIPEPEGAKAIDDIKIETRRFPFPALVGHLKLLTEYSFNSRLSFISEIRLRYGRISCFKGTESLERIYYDPSGNVQGIIKAKDKGFLYYFSKEDQDIGERYFDLHVWSNLPDATPEFMRDIRKASLDLTGVSFKLGLKIKLF
ncbi:MAG: hypothetical protein NUW11_01695 [Candidatus Saccharicenans sp.]|jgi:hypothetical protein|nr:hypothetical protein [Candidatus Saccharicenans sp.]